MVSTTVNEIILVFNYVYRLFNKDNTELKEHELWISKILILSLVV